MREDFVLSDIEFADDCELCAETEEDMQKMLDIIRSVTAACGQAISTKKTKSR